MSDVIDKVKTSRRTLLQINADSRVLEKLYTDKMFFHISSYLYCYDFIFNYTKIVLYNIYDLLIVKGKVAKNTLTVISTLSIINRTCRTIICY